MDIIILTGASKGIGLELSLQLKQKGKKLIGIARTVQSDEEDFISADLSDTSSVEGLIVSIIEKNIDSASSFTLINNAGVVDPIGLIGSVQAEVITKAIDVNLTAPILMSNAFISELKNFDGLKKIINISSGAGRKPYEGWGTYCMTKAGIDHFTRVVALEQKTAKYPVEVVAIAPGIIDTGMQETIRASAADEFPLLAQFIDYKDQGLLSSAEQTAQKLIAFMENENVQATGPIVDIRDY